MQLSTKKKKYLIVLFAVFCIILFLLVYKQLDKPNLNISSVAINNKVENAVFEIVNDSDKDIAIDIRSENLFNNKYKELFGKRKTEWIPIDSEMQHLSIYGGFNCAKWEFINSEGKITSIDFEEYKYNHNYYYNIENKASESVEIPSDSKYVRVQYFDKYNLGFVETLKFIYHKQIKEIGKILDNNEKIASQTLYIVYGRFPTTATVSDGDELVCKENGKFNLKYDSGSWYVVCDGKEKIIADNLPLDIGATVSVKSDSKDLDFKLLSSEKDSINTDGVYGVCWDRESTSIVGERCNDAKYLRTNYMIDDRMAGIYENDFDKIYPWSEVKLCQIDDKNNISYDIDYNNDVMVEIPKFYYCRKIEDGKEIIQISGKNKKGFELAPCFMLEDGECDSIFVGAYLANLVNKEISSMTGDVPIIDLSYKEILDLEKEKGEEWSELDISSLNAIQMLFLVETAVRDSQTIFEGNVGLTFIWSSDNDPKLAVKSETKTNRIVIKKDEYNKKFSVGDYVSVETGENWWDAYSIFTEDYVNGDHDNWIRKIESIKEDNKTYSIEFSGNPIDIVEGVSTISHLPMQNGKTDGIEYHTGTYEGMYGCTSFKYRNMENLWGNVCVILDGISVDDKENIEIVYPNGKKNVLSFKSPEQYVGSASVYSEDCAIHSLGLDEQNSAILYPDTICQESLLTNTYGDWFMKIKREDTSKKQYVTYGMTWDMSNYAGLFAYRVDPFMDTKKVENGARLIYRKK